MIIRAVNNNTKKEISCSINSNQDADVAFQDISMYGEILEYQKYKSIVLLIPFCKNSDEIRAESKPYRVKYGIDKTYIMDIDETYLVHRNLDIPFGDKVPTLELAKQYLINQGFSTID